MFDASLTGLTHQDKDVIEGKMIITFDNSGSYSNELEIFDVVINQSLLSFNAS